MKTNIDNAKNLNELKVIGNNIANTIKTMEGGRHREMNLKDIKEVCKANQIKLSRVVDGKRVAYKKKELMTKLKRKKLL
jgi:threonine aldolase